MLSRNSISIDATPKHPGPGHHDPEEVTVHKPRPPAFFLGIKHSDFVTPLVTGMSQGILLDSTAKTHQSWTTEHSEAEQSEGRQAASPG
ncbi:hypothetical protein AAFF_G00005370 [Aldrovandia affinis]|uniref:Uncharacterized protein n=1 Tax=Aldrovandia affinis TaxID=143900 RepID=A0AAD7X3Z7_9TELE|nr:hypothetical protein AAFF_G00005370 [Aldrovandia affinis]